MAFDSGSVPLSRVVLFDIDGTLLLSNEAHAAAWSEAVGEFGFERPPSFFRPLMGMGGDRVLQLVGGELVPGSGTGERIVERRKTIYRQTYFPHVTPSRGARALVERFYVDGWICAIATSASAEELSLALERVDIAKMIAVMANGSDVESSKPSPDVVQAAMRKANASPDRSLLIGDTPYDVEAGNLAGVVTIALLTGGRTREELSGAAAVFDDPQAVLDDFGALNDLLPRLS